MLNIKRILLLLLAIALCIGFSVNSVAVERPSSPSDEVEYAIRNNIPVVTEKDIIAGYESFVSRDRRSYWRTVEQIKKSNVEIPDRYYWPQQIYYTEENPYGTGMATGYLDFVSAVPINGTTYDYYRLTYSGYLYYYE